MASALPRSRWAPSARSRGLALLHPHFASAEECNHAEFAINQLPAEHRAVAYGLMAAAAGDATTHRRWFEAELAAISELTSDVKRIAALERAAGHTPGALWDELLAAAGAIRNEARRGKAFRQLLPCVPERLLGRVMHAMLAARRFEVSTRWRLVAVVRPHRHPCASASSTCLRRGASCRRASAARDRGAELAGPGRSGAEGGQQVVGIEA